MLNVCQAIAPAAHRDACASAANCRIFGSSAGEAPQMTSSPRPLALVTGASSGIGADLARELARDGHDLVLTARTLAPMQALAVELETHGARAVVIPADLSQPGVAAALAGEIETRGLGIDMLVNNAGLGAIGRFDQMDPGRIGEMLQVNV